MEFVSKKLPAYDDINVFNYFINNKEYNILNYSSLSDNYIKNNMEEVLSLIRTGEYIFNSNSPKIMKENDLFYLASFESGNLNPLFMYKGNIKNFDGFFIDNYYLLDNIIDVYKNKIKFKKIIEFNSVITFKYFELLNYKICNKMIDFNSLNDDVIPYLNDDSIKIIYGENSSEFRKRYGNLILLNGKYEYINTLSKSELDKFFDVFKVKNGSIQNLLNLYNALVDYNFLCESNCDILNNQSFSKIGFNKEYNSLLISEIKQYIDCDKLNKNVSLEDLFDRYIKLYGSDNYKDFNYYADIIRSLCKEAYDNKREEFIKQKTNFDNGYPFKVYVSSKMKRIINKKKLMNDTIIDVSSDANKLDLLKKYLVNKGYIDNDFDTNILYALLIGGPKSIKLIDLDINVNYLMGKILNYISSLISVNIDNDISYEEYKNLPLNDDCFESCSNITDIVNKMDIEYFFEHVIKDYKVYDLFKKYIDKLDILYFSDNFKLCDVAYSKDMSYSLNSLINLVNNFDKVCYSNKKGYKNIFDMIKRSTSISNPLNKYERIFGESNKWIINDPYPHSSLISPDKKISECINIYREMLIRQYISVPILTIKEGNLIVTNDNFYDENILVTGEKLGSCMRAGGVLDKLFKYTLLSPNGFNIIIKDNDLVSRIAGVCFGNTIFLNELREDVNNRYDNEYLFKLLKKYILLLVKESSKSGKVIEQVFIPSGLQGTRNIKDNIVKSDMFLDLKNGKYGINMDYDDEAIILYGDNVKSVRNDYNYYSIPRFKLLTNECSIKRINMLRALYKNEWDYIDNFDYSVCSSNWYVYVKNGNVCSYIYGDVNKEEYENVKNMISIKKSI